MVYNPSRTTILTHKPSTPYMSVPSTSRSAVGVRRVFSTTPATFAPLTAAVSAARRKTERVKRIPRVKDLTPFRFDDPTSYGWLRLEKIREAEDLAKKVEANHPVLRGRLVALVSL